MQSSISPNTRDCLDMQTNEFMPISERSTHRLKKTMNGSFAWYYFHVHSVYDVSLLISRFWKKLRYLAIFDNFFLVAKISTVGGSIRLFLLYDWESTFESLHRAMGSANFNWKSFIQFLPLNREFNSIRSVIDFCFSFLLHDII